MKIVIIGNGMAGFKLCEKLVSKSLSRFQIAVFGEEPRPAYDRVHLTDYFSGVSPAQLSLTPEGWYEQHGISLHLSDPIVRIDRIRKVVSSQKGIEETYDYLVFATGSAPFVPSIPGVDRPGVFVYRTIQDLEKIAAYARHIKKASVLGGGLLGLEAAKAMLDLGLKDTTVIEFASRLMPRQLDAPGSSILREKLEALGMKVMTGSSLIGITGAEGISTLHFSDESSVATDMLVISAGIKPRDDLAKAIGLPTAERGGIIVNDMLQTADPFIFAIGECAVHNNILYGLVAPAYEMAEVVASHLSGGSKIFNGFDMSTKLKLVGVDVASFGDPFTEDRLSRSIVFEDKLKGLYKRINISNDGKRLLGGILVGDVREYNMLLQTCRNNLVLPPEPGDFIRGNAGGKDAGSNGGVNSLPAEAIICSCESVSKAAITDAVSEGGCENFESIKKCTRAGTGCGGCVPMVKDIINHTLKAQGRYIRNVICEHFQYSRQELFDLIRYRQLKSFEETLDAIGKGDGCELCKPTISSILASLWSEMILTNGNDTAQDSNDRFLANIQKGGTYSVVPRIPGGEITPDKLIVIGRVAKKYNLYTKITGGQRIDMFGAHVNDLPKIWEELIVAGFESGHAYGKALRTVKSCVGSTWCRFGLHDSVSFAIRVEERYRGLRAPHKIKSAVSGCIRECAEAQSKDFGIIATEGGWNLYVCGNGGSKPQHALLLASNIDSDTCIRYIDRFLMFYVRTADPLTRTATWLNKMDGGIDYLRSVVVYDSLGIASELEAEMQGLVDNYQCEWKQVVDSPELKKRFAHFVNAPEEKDPSVRFEPLRDQKKAAEWK